MSDPQGERPDAWFREYGSIRSSVIPVRLRMAWACLNGRSVSYRMDFEKHADGRVSIVTRTRGGFMVECRFVGGNVRRDT
jgi:hypothetical protein